VVVSDTSSIVGGMLFDTHGEREFDIFGMIKDLGMRIVDVIRDESVYCQACNCI